MSVAGQRRTEKREGSPLPRCQKGGVAGEDDARCEEKEKEKEKEEEDRVGGGSDAEAIRAAGTRRDNAIYMLRRGPRECAGALSYPPKPSTAPTCRTATALHLVQNCDLTSPTTHSCSQRLLRRVVGWGRGRRVKTGREKEEKGTRKASEGEGGGQGEAGWNVPMESISISNRTIII